MTTVEQNLALQLYDIGGVMDRNCIHPKLNPKGKGFRLVLHDTQPDAPLSPFYLNLRTPSNPKPGPLTPEILTNIGQVMFAKSLGSGLYFPRDYRRVVSVPNAGDPFVRAFSAAGGPTPIPYLLLKKEEGREFGDVAEGEYEAGETDLLMDDLITKAGSKGKAIERLRRMGISVAHVMVLVDREQGGSAELVKQGYGFTAVFTINQMLRLYLEAERMNQEMYNEITTYLATS